MTRLIALLPVAALSAVVAATASAACFCTLPSPPQLPDGSSADAQQMQYTSRQIESYQSNVRNYKQCLEQCLVEADETSGNVIDDWNARVEEFNARMEASP